MRAKKKQITKVQGNSKLKVRIDDKGPIKTLSLKAGPYNGPMAIKDIITELKTNSKRVILNSKGLPYSLEKLSKFFDPETPIKTKPTVPKREEVKKEEAGEKEEVEVKETVEVKEVLEGKKKKK